MNPSIQDVIAKRRDKCIAIILSVKDRECDPYLPTEASRSLRKSVLDQVNSLCDLVTDLITSIDTDQIVVNELYVERLESRLDAITERLS